MQKSHHKASNYYQVSTHLRYMLHKAIVSLLWPASVVCLCGGDRSSFPVKKSLQPVSWGWDWKWQRGFLSMFEEQLLTFPTKSSNMLSATSGLWAWQSLGFSCDYGNICRCLLPEGKKEKKGPRGAFTQAYHQASPPSNSPSLCWIPPSEALWLFLSL